jgi:hypothetical protein
VCTSEDATRARLLDLCRMQFEEIKARAHEELERLLEDERSHPITYNHYYTDNIQKHREDSLKKALKRALYQDNGVHHTSASVHLTTQTVANIISKVRSDCMADMDKQACREALEGMKAYYKVIHSKFNPCREPILLNWQLHFLNLPGRKPVKPLSRHDSVHC